MTNCPMTRREWPQHHVIGMVQEMLNLYGPCPRLLDYPVFKLKDRLYFSIDMIVQSKL